MTTFDQIKQIIIHVTGVPEPLIKPDADLSDDLGLDSLDTIEVAMAAEDEFGVLIRDEVLEKILTVQDAVDAVDHALSNRGVVA